MKVVIIGARGDGHGNVVREILESAGDHEVVGFIDDDPAKHGTRIRDHRVLGGMEVLPDLLRAGRCRGAIVAIGVNRRRRQLAAEAVAAGAELVNAVHPTAHVDSDVILGRGICLCQGTIIVTGTRVGDCVNIHTGATIDHDNRLQDGANLGPGVHCAGRVKIGRDATIGTGAALIPDAEVGDGAVVGAGAVVLGRVEAHTMVVGVPARTVRDLPTE